MRNLLLFLLISVFFFSCRKEPNNDPRSLPDSYSNQTLGASAHDLLSSDKYTGLLIQIQYMPGYAIDSAAVTNVQTYLNSLCNKPGGITITQTQIAGSGDTLTLDKVAVLERQNRTAYTNGSTLVLYIVVTDGYDTSVATLGFAYRNTSICLFGKDIFDHSGHPGEFTRVSLESSVLEHELGHIMGLVNLGSPMQAAHQDTPHGNHCTNTKCLMYYAIENHTAMSFLTISKIPTLDSSCRNDLKANGGK